MNNLAETILKIMDEKIQSISPQMIIAKVSSIPPNLKLEYANIVIESEQIYCSNYLLPHYHRTYTDIREQEVSSYSFDNTTSTEVAANHTHAIKSLAGSGTIKSTGKGEIWLEDTLKIGDEVLVVVVGVLYVVVSKITKMPSGAKEGV